MCLVLAITQRHGRIRTIRRNNLNVQRLNNKVGNILHLILKFLKIQTLFIIVISQINQNIGDPVNNPNANVFW